MIEQHKTEQLDQMFKRSAFIQIKRAAEWLGISKNTIYRYIESGRISEIKVLPTGHIRIDRPTLERIYGELYKTKRFGQVVDD